MIAQNSLTETALTQEFTDLVHTAGFISGTAIAYPTA
jgi:hypothetical protein